MKKLLTAITVTAFLFTLGCASEMPVDTEPAKATKPETPEIPRPAESEVTHEWVQDAWLFNRVAYFDEDGVEVDVTDQIIAHLESSTANESEEIADGIVFSAYDSLKPSLTTEDGDTRKDVAMTAGIMNFDGEEVLTVLATPDADAKDPVDIDNFVELDLTFLGDAFKPGTAMTFAYGFMQSIPGDDPTTASPAELLKHRLADGRVNFYGDEDDDTGNLLVFDSAMGIAVEGSTRMRMSGKGRISDPAMDGFRDGAWEARKGGVGGVQGFFNSFGDGARSSNSLINCNLSSNCERRKPKKNERKKEKKCRVFCGKAHGDPHLITFDGLNYAPQAVGEFLLVEADDLTVQMRSEPAKGSRTVSVVTAAALEAAGEKISIMKKDNERLLFVNEEEVVLERVADNLTVGDLELTHSTGEVRVETASGALITAVFAARGITLYVDPGAQGSDSQSSGSQTQITGMLGNADGDKSNDLVTRDGRKLASDIFKTDSKAFYEDFVNSWRISEEESLFYYFPEESTEFFTDLSFPSESLSFADIPTKDLKVPLAVCEAAGIKLQPLLDNCIFDFWVTGDIEFVTAAKSAELHEGIFSGEYSLAADIYEDEDLADEEPSGEDSSRDKSGSDASSAEWPRGFAPEDGESPEKYVERLWQWNAHSWLWEGDKYEHYCPPLKGTNFAYQEQEVWGGGSNTGYTSDSPACIAAVHSGKIKPETGGLVSIEMLAGSESYPAAPPANSVKPLTWDSSWSSGFVFN